MKVKPEIAARAIRLAAWYEEREPGCDALARADYDGCELTLRAIRPYTDWRTEAVQDLLRSLRRTRRSGDPMRWNDRITNLARIAGDALESEPNAST